jgi:hypothetical protein
MMRRDVLKSTRGPRRDLFIACVPQTRGPEEISRVRACGSDNAKDGSAGGMGGNYVRWTEAN